MPDLMRATKYVPHGCQLPKHNAEHCPVAERINAPYDGSVAAQAEVTRLVGLGYHVEIFQQPTPPFKM